MRAEWNYYYHHHTTPFPGYTSPHVKERRHNESTLTHVETNDNSATVVKRGTHKKKAKAEHHEANFNLQNDIRSHHRGNELNQNNNTTTTNNNNTNNNTNNNNNVDDNINRNVVEVTPEFQEGEFMHNNEEEEVSLLQRPNSTVEVLTASLAALSQSTSQVVHSITNAVQHGRSRLYDNFTSTDYYTGTLGNLSDNNNSEINMSSDVINVVNNRSLASTTATLYDSSADMNFDFLEDRGAGLLGIERDEFTSNNN